MGKKTVVNFVLSTRQESANVALRTFVSSRPTIKMSGRMGSMLTRIIAGQQ